MLRHIVTFVMEMKSDHGQEGVSFNTVDLEPKDARKKFRNFNMTSENKFSGSKAGILVG